MNCAEADREPSVVDYKCFCRSLLTLFCDQEAGDKFYEHRITTAACRLPSGILAAIKYNFGGEGQGLIWQARGRELIVGSKGRTPGDELRGKAS